VTNPFGGLLGPLAPPPIDEETSHCEALGRFITAYATAEAAVHILARKLSGLSDEKARAIFARMGMEDVMERARAMMRADKTERKIFADVDACFVQLKLIAKCRHKLGIET
jgi:hypothetical protein